jgi:hypothetical protein
MGERGGFDILQYNDLRWRGTHAICLALGGYMIHVLFTNTNTHETYSFDEHLALKKGRKRRQNKKRIDRQ